ncbi:hypothetical protein CBNA_1476 [Coxiella burnetii str. Namibia]|nr:hypothetical protein CBNA_1476 [Coxiella burnetii str. Namibia]
MTPSLRGGSISLDYLAGSTNAKNYCYRQCQIKRI